MDVISLRPNYTFRTEQTICHTKMKEIYSKKYVLNENKKETIPDIILDCENAHEILSETVPEQWERYSLDDMLSCVFTPVKIINSADMEDFYMLMDQELGIEEDELYSEEENE